MEPCILLLFHRLQERWHLQNLGDEKWRETRSHGYPGTPDPQAQSKEEEKKFRLQLCVLELHLHSYGLLFHRIRTSRWGRITWGWRRAYLQCQPRRSDLGNGENYRPGFDKMHGQSPYFPQRHADLRQQWQNSTSRHLWEYYPQYLWRKGISFDASLVLPGPVGLQILSRWALIRGGNIVRECISIWIRLKWFLPYLPHWAVLWKRTRQVRAGPKYPKTCPRSVEPDRHQRTVEREVDEYQGASLYQPSVHWCPSVH